MATFTAIGVGMGDSDMLTLQAVHALEKIDVLYVPTSRQDAKSRAHQIVSEFLKPSLLVRERHFPMTHDPGILQEAWQSIARDIERDIAQGRETGFVTIGDPMIYSTFQYLLEILRERVDIRIIPGISSFQTIAALEKFPLCEGEHPLVILPATIGLERMEQYLHSETNLVIMKVYRCFEALCEKIQEAGLAPHALVVSNVQQPTYKVFNLSERIPQEEISYFTTVLINKEWKK